ncbi:hypothetical protein [Halalkalicoccus sp. NIPERK01]|uniref:hypothetical protein n=1 Tax=Halalkalicoccus sp. NIPERK01 TaxID=3053469 RepID=UPI00256F30DD|nr:hypothetical protein [Halalkalicoccus sp. NIPERK01]MDL5363178.1 hypothetical protein [Halalkalicoccus sp. NIPERK01]
MSGLTDFVEANESDILSYEVYFSGDGDRMTVVHMHSDPATLEYHVDAAGPKFSPVGELLELEAIDVYGDPGEDLLQRLREKASTLGTGRVSIHDLHEGFDRITTG